MIGQKRTEKGCFSVPVGTLFPALRLGCLSSHFGQKRPYLPTFNVKLALLAVQKGQFNPDLD